jgi:hypothetical protein
MAVFKITGKVIYNKLLKKSEWNRVFPKNLLDANKIISAV